MWKTALFVCSEDIDQNNTQYRMAGVYKFELILHSFPPSVKPALILQSGVKNVVSDRVPH